MDHSVQWPIAEEFLEIRAQVCRRFVETVGVEVVAEDAVDRAGDMPRDRIDSSGIWGKACSRISGI